MAMEATPGIGIGADVIDEARVKKLTLYYVGASTVFLFVAGLLGLLLRESQADFVRIDPGAWYAIMTAHGLGAFVAWAAFAVMGLSFWVLAEVGFRMRPMGSALAWTGWWTMVIGVVGIVITTLGMNFGASWVFLYPLPFNATNEWGDAATGIFSASVLLVGVSIITWCMSILHTVVGPGLGAPEGSGVLRRFGASLGFGYIWPNVFRTERPVPYPVIPLAVIGIDMIIATLPLAALLIVMIIQSIDPSVTIDDLLAKNLLWFFGHPVVYLLLFPAVAVFYLLIPRYAKRELVAGKIVAFAWFVAVIVNVIVWAHHIYTDYPEGTIQATLNASMQPLTFAITLPSAISLYSLSATIWRSDFEWSPAAKFLGIAMLSWFTAGLQGVVNATIVFNETIHNTMWVVGHFHNMALLNIGLVIFAGIYAFLPKLTGKQWYSESLANSHLILTVVGGYGMALPMLVQGLEGAPRRYAVLPSQYDTLTQLTIPFVIITALGQVVFAYNLIQSLRGQRFERKETVLRSAGLTASLLAGALVIGGSAVAFNEKDAGESAQKPELGGGAATETAGDPGRQLFVDACGSCHTFAPAGTEGRVGPDLEAVPLTEASVLAAIKNGGRGTGTMPKELLVGEQAQDVAAYLAKEAGG